MTRTNKRTLKDLHEAPPSVGPKATHKGQANPDMNEQKAMTLIVQKNRFPGETAPPLPDIFVPLDGGVVSTGAPTAPGIPGLNSAIPGPTTVDLSWSVPGNGGSAITGFNVYRGTSPGGEVLLTSLGVTTTFNDTGLTNGTTYYYRVSALNAIGESIPSNELSATPASSTTAPGAPTLTAATPGNAVMDLTWTAPASNGGSAITGYKVYRGTASGAETLLTTLGVVLTFHDTGLANGTAYFYKVSALNAIGEGAQSNERSAAPTAPSGPTLLDDFNRGNSTDLGANWTFVPGVPAVNRLALNGNAARAAGGTYADAWNVTSFGTDWELNVKLTIPDSGAHLWLLGAITTPGAGSYTGYLCDIVLGAGTYSATIYRGVAGSYTNLGSASGVAFAVNNTFGLRKIGALLTMLQNGSGVSSLTGITDAAPVNSGYLGIGGSGSSTLAVDDFSGG